MTEIDTGFPMIDEALRAMQVFPLGAAKVVTTYKAATVEVHDVNGQKVIVAEIPPNVQVQIPLSFDQVVALRAGLAPEDA